MLFCGFFLLWDKLTPIKSIVWVLNCFVAFRLLPGQLLQSRNPVSAIPIIKLWSWRAVLITVSRLLELTAVCRELMSDRTWMLPSCKSNIHIHCQEETPFSEPVLQPEVIKYLGLSWSIPWEYFLQSQLGQGYPHPLPHLISNVTCKGFQVCMPRLLNSHIFWNPFREALRLRKLQPSLF